MIASLIKIENKTNPLKKCFKSIVKIEMNEKKIQHKRIKAGR